MRILHTSDWHLGKRLNDRERAGEQVAVMDEIVRVADEEGFPAVAATFRFISKVEAEHEARYRTLLARVEADKVFERDEEIEWQCRNCGYVHKGKNAPEMCPSCSHPKAFFEPKKNNY